MEPGLPVGRQVLECWLQRCWEIRGGQSCRGGRKGGDLLLYDGEGSPGYLSSC